MQNYMVSWIILKMKQLTKGGGKPTYQGINSICNIQCHVYLIARLGSKLEKRRNTERKKRHCYGKWSILWSITGEHIQLTLFCPSVTVTSDRFVLLLSIAVFFNYPLYFITSFQLRVFTGAYVYMAFCCDVWGSRTDSDIQLHHVVFKKTLTKHGTSFRSTPPLSSPWTEAVLLNNMSGFLALMGSCSTQTVHV